MRYDNESGLYHTLYRKYSAYQGRFTTHDPLRSLNPYVYAASNPINLTDPLGLWVEVPGQANVWLAEDGDSLQKLATMATEGGSQDDWVCLWAVEMRDSGGYPAVKKCDKFDVSNLTSTSSNSVKVSVKATFMDLATLNLSAFVGATRYASSSKMYETVGKSASYGGTPISQLIVVGHSNKNLSFIASKDLAVKFSGAGLSTYSTNKGYPAGTNTYTKASKKQGPLRCWFTKGARVYGAACYTNTWARLFAQKALRKKAAYAYGTRHTIWGVLPWVACIQSCHTTLGGFLGDNSWKGYEGSL
jgi:hypothetical protein